MILACNWSRICPIFQYVEPLSFSNLKSNDAAAFRRRPASTRVAAVFCIFVRADCPTSTISTSLLSAIEHHSGRRKWWESEYSKAEDQLKEKGFEYRKRQDTYEPGLQIVGDPELAQRAAECRQKVAEHRERNELYETWIRALAARTERQSEEELELTINDVVFFGL